MKRKAYLFLLAAAAVIALAGCRTRHTCPAYNHGSVHVAQPATDRCA